MSEDVRGHECEWKLIAETQGIQIIKLRAVIDRIGPVASIALLDDRAAIVPIVADKAVKEKVRSLPNYGSFHEDALAVWCDVVGAARLDKE